MSFMACKLLISIPVHRCNAKDDEVVLYYQKLFGMHNVETSWCDTVYESWNLDQDWLQIGPLKCEREWNWVKPVCLLPEEWELFFNDVNWGRITVLISDETPK